MKTRVLLLGSNGMLGSACKKILLNSSSIELFSTAKIPISNNIKFDAEKESIEDLVSQINPKWIINCIGLIKSRINEKSINSVNAAIQINSLFPLKLGFLADQFDINLIQIATDCVFNGSRGNYNENDAHDAKDIYGKTKSLGEYQGKNILIIRSSIIGHEIENKNSLLEWFLAHNKNSTLNGFINHHWNGVTTYHFAKLCLNIIEQDSLISGNFHLVPKNKVTKFQLLQTLKNEYQRQDLNIIEAKATENIDRVLSTAYPKINNNFWQLMGYSSALTIEEMISESSKFFINR